jgi:DNA-binding CsgD family transcriptional regulator
MFQDSYVVAVLEMVFAFLDRGPAAVLLDRRRRLVYVSERAEQLAARQDGITLSDDILSLSRKADDSQLNTAISLALDGGGRSVLRAHRRQGRSYRLLVAPFSCRLTPRLDSPAVAIVFWDPDTVTSPPLDRLQMMFGLTEAEGRLATILAAGEDLKAAATTLGITYGTARTRLAEIFQKTNTRRQGELINLLLTTGTFL